MAGGLRALFRKEQVSRELDEELNGFLEMAAEAQDEAGMSRLRMRFERRVWSGEPRSYEG